MSREDIEEMLYTSLIDFEDKYDFTAIQKYAIRYFIEHFLESYNSQSGD